MKEKERSERKKRNREEEEREREGNLARQGEVWNAVINALFGNT